MNKVTVILNGKNIRIPVDDKGYVPEEELIKRFAQNVEKKGIRNRKIDYDKEAEVILPIRLTPREAAAWWSSPNEYDIEYIDAPGRPLHNVRGISDPESKEIHKMIGVVCPPSMEKNVRKLIDEAYPLNERKKLVKDGPVTITVRPLNSAGNISGRRISLDIDNGMNNSTVVHEGTHLSHL